MKKNQFCKITINNEWNESEVITAQYLSKGSFSKVYHVDFKTVYVYIRKIDSVEFDYSKEILSQLDNVYLPAVESLGYVVISGLTYNLYKMPFYQKLTAGYKEAYTEYKAIKKIWENALCEYNTFGGYYKNCTMIEKMELTGIDSDIVGALRELNDMASNYNLDYTFEFPLRNLAVDSKGNLILLDVIFNRRALVAKLNGLYKQMR